ncbi:tigger transposable element-derived protein 4-like [Drosophila sulfurigaster albostrigata]|uniref:tigger transposable element-derived protein 4-like n=1 Tax=Drosophila sulfurigaster albostrigata TaxID=89887 RepID=UPI002D21ECED|nr:tigger transposable element-derived protein 4-like [Drosophila sulfurigaster albostrigata]
MFVWGPTKPSSLRRNNRTNRILVYSEINVYVLFSLSSTVVQYTRKMSSKRKCFSVEKKMEIIQRLEAGERNVTLAKEYGVCHTTIATINKNKEKIKTLFNNNFLKTKRVRASTQDQVDKALLQWYIMQRSQGITLSGPQLQEKANFFAKQFQIEHFNCSASWISRFKVRHNIGGTISEESLSVQKSEWLTKVWPILRKDFNDEEIFSAAETGLFYKLTPDKTLQFKGEKCTEGKLSKERITVLVAANMSGNLKKPLLIIGKSMRPRCFQNVQYLPVDYYSNRQAWMTSTIFMNCVRHWDAELQTHKKKILLLVDNCPTHPQIGDLTNITLVFLPPNTTSVLQPMDQGIIRVIKSTFRKNLVLKIISNMDENKDENYPKITILDAILMINDAWQQLSPLTIANSFKHSGLAEEILDGPSSSFPNDIEIEDDIPLSVWAGALTNQLPIIKEELDEYDHIDNSLAICEEPFEERIVKNDDNDDSDDNVEDQNEDVPAPSVLEAFKAAEILNRFVHSNFNDESLTHSISLLNNAVRYCYYMSKTDY